MFRKLTTTLIILSSLVAIAFLLNRQIISKNDNLEAAAVAAPKESPVVDKKPEGLLDDIIDGKTVLYSISKSSVLKTFIVKNGDRYIWEGRLYAISPQYANHGFRLGQLSERGILSSDGKVVMLEYNAYSPNCGNFWNPGWNYNIVPKKFRDKDVWTFDQIGRGCAAPFVENETCRVTRCEKWSDDAILGEKFSYLVKDKELAMQIYATRPDYDPSWITDTWD